MPCGNFQLSWARASGLLDSEQVLLRSFLMFRCEGRPRSNKVESDMLRLCCTVGASRGSRFSARGEFRFDAGDAVEKGFDTAKEGVVIVVPVLGDRLGSEALSGVWPPDEIGVRVDLLGLELSLAGDGEPLRSTEGDLGGTRGGSSKWSGTLMVSSLNTVVLGLTPGLMMGERGLPVLLGWSDPKGDGACGAKTGEGPVTHDIIASPKGPDLQFVPGALKERSWPGDS
jgi:hypothetical protein